MTMRRRIEVNLEELDQIIDRSTRAPLSQSEGQKLKTAIHAMAERLSWKRTTEKTSAVLPQDATADKSETGKSTPAGHGRHSAARVQRRRQGGQHTRHSPFRRQVPRVPPGKSIWPERASHAGEVCRTRTIGSNGIRNGATTLQCMRGGLHR